MTSDPSGAVFISYRTSDGQPIARRLARSLRAHGVPVWLDETDLPPGDINRRLEEALAAGLSGGVLVVTPDVSNSSTIRSQEAPRLIELARDPRFALAIVSNVTRLGSTSLDYTAPPVLLGVNPDVFGNPKIYRAESIPTPADQLRELAQWMATNRVTNLRRDRPSVPFLIDVQSRGPTSARAGNGDLVFRTVQPGSGRQPDREVWEDLRSFLAYLPRVLGDAGANDVELRGGSHLSMAFALGASLPPTTPYRVSVHPTTGPLWVPAESARGNLMDTIAGIGLDLVGRLRRGRPVSIFVDINEHPEDGAFGRYLLGDGHGHRHHTIVHRSVVTERTGPDTVRRVIRRIRRIAAHQSTSEVNLFVRAPWPAAVLLGRGLNTMKLRLFEWERRDGLGTYHPVITVASGEGESPIQDIL